MKETMSVKSNAKKVKTIHCPVSGCLYFNGSERHFTKKKFLNQHIAKVHAEKKFFCTKCNKGFGLDWWRNHHEKTCGIEWKCHCGAKYSSREALLTHARRSQHKLEENYGRQAKIPEQVNNTPIILLIQPIIQNFTCSQPVQNSVISPHPIFPKPSEPSQFSLPVSENPVINLSNPNYSSAVQDLSNESFVFNISNSCRDTIPNQYAPVPVLPTDVVSCVIEKPIQKTISTQTGLELEYPTRSRESTASQCSRRKSKVLAVGIESTHTQTAESAVVKIKRRRSRRKSVAITTESSMLTGQISSTGQSLWPDFKDLIVPNANISGFKNTTSTQTTTNKVLCDSQTLTDDELFKIVFDEAVKSKDTNECFNSLVGMLPDMTSDDQIASFHEGIDQNNLPMMDIFPHTSSISPLDPNNRKESSSEEMIAQPLSAPQIEETCTIYSAFGDCTKQTQTIPSNVLNYDLFNNLEPSISNKVSDTHTQTIAPDLLDYNILANMETQTTDDFSLYDLEFSDTETQTPWDDFPNIEDSPLPADQLSIEIQTDFSSLTPSLGHSSYDFMGGLSIPSMMGGCSGKEVSGVNSETQTQDKFTFPQFTNSESQTIDLSDFMFAS